MALTDDQEEKARYVIAELDSDASKKLLNDWEKKFLADQVERYDTYGSQMTITPKQWAILERMFEKVTE